MNKYVYLMHDGNLKRIQHHLRCMGGIIDVSLVSTIAI